MNVGMTFLTLGTRLLILKTYRKTIFTTTTSISLNSLPRKVTLLEDRESVIHLRNLSLHPANNEEEGGCGLYWGTEYTVVCLYSIKLAVLGRHQQDDGRGKRELK